MYETMIRFLCLNIPLLLYYLEITTNLEYYTYRISERICVFNLIIISSSIFNLLRRHSKQP